MPNHLNATTSTSTTLEITDVTLSSVVSLSAEQKILYGNHKTAITDLTLTSAGIHYTFNPTPLAQTSSSIIYQLTCSQGTNPDLALKVIPKAPIKKSIHLLRPLYVYEAKHNYKFELSPSNKLHEDNDNFYLPMFKAPGIELFKFIKQHDTKYDLPCETGLAVIGYILEAIANCHAKQVLHRDIKPENMMLDLKKGRITLLDYGFAIPTQTDNTYTNSFRCGSEPYTAPECTVKGKARYSFYSDVYAMGICIGFINPCFDDKTNPSIINLLETYYHMMTRHRPPEKRYLTHHYLLLHAWAIKALYAETENIACIWAERIIEAYPVNTVLTAYPKYADFIVDLIGPVKQCQLAFKNPTFIPTPLLTKIISLSEEQEKNSTDTPKHLKSLTTIARHIMNAPTASSEEKKTAKGFLSPPDRELEREATISDNSGFWYHPRPQTPPIKNSSSRKKQTQ